GQRELIQQNEGFLGFLTDDDYRVRLAMRFLPDGSNEVLEPDGQGGWKRFTVIPHEDTLTTHPAGFDKTGNVLYIIDSRGRNTAALKSLDLATRTEKLVAENDLADISGVMSHPTELTIEAVSFNYERVE